MLHFESDSGEKYPWIYSHWVYNGLDNCLTYELEEAIDLDPVARKVYEFEIGMYPMIWCMMQRGMLIDQRVRKEMLDRETKVYADLESWLNQLSMAVQDTGINSRSPAQLKNLFYKVLGLPPVYSRKRSATGERSVTTDREALEKLSDYLYARPFTSTIMALRDIKETLKVLARGAHPDGRMRFSFNPAGTETQRWSSSKNPDRIGTNFQNITDKLRRMFIADPGYKLAYIDLAQADSRSVAYLSGDENYIAACESGDLHTAVARMIWPELPWTGDLKADKKLAEEPFYRHFSRRDISKRGGHATNYDGKAGHIAKELRVEQELIQSFQSRYFRAFPGIPVWQHDVAQRLATGEMTFVTGFRRQFLGRLNDERTYKEALAAEPQNVTSWVTSEGLNRCFWAYDRGAPNAPVQVIGNVHDAGVFQYREDSEGRAAIQSCLEIMSSVKVHYPKVGWKSLPADCKVGYNWGKWAEDNPNGLVDPGSPKELSQSPPDYSAISAMELLQGVL